MKQKQPDDPGVKETPKAAKPTVPKRLKKFLTAQKQAFKGLFLMGRSR